MDETFEMIEAREQPLNEKMQENKEDCTGLPRSS